MRGATPQRSTPLHERVRAPPHNRNRPAMATMAQGTRQQDRPAIRRCRGRQGNKTGPTQRWRQHDNHTPIHDERIAGNTNAGDSGTPHNPTACGYDDGEPKQRAGHTPVAAQQTPHPTCRPRQDLDHKNSPEQAARRQAFTRRTKLRTRRLHDRPGRNSASSSRKHQTTNKPTIRRLTLPCTNQTAAETTTRP